MDREKLSKVVSESMRYQEGRTRWQRTAQRLRDSWGRFGALAVWERAILVGGGVLAVILLPVVIVAIAASGGDGDVQVTRPPDTPTAATTAAATPTPRVEAMEPTPRPLYDPRPTHTPDENRRDCDEIAGTAYRSSAERDWYLANCAPEEEDTDDGQSVVAPPGGQTTRPPAPPPPPPPPPTAPPSQPPPSTGLDASGAIALAVAWIPSHGPVAYTVSADDCSAVLSGAHWVVTCDVTVQGCVGAACQATVTVCVFEQPLVVDWC